MSRGGGIRRLVARIVGYLLLVAAFVVVAGSSMLLSVPDAAVDAVRPGLTNTLVAGLAAGTLGAWLAFAPSRRTMPSPLRGPKVMLSRGLVIFYWIVLPLFGFAALGALTSEVQWTDPAWAPAATAAVVALPLLVAWRLFVHLRAQRRYTESQRVAEFD